MKVRMDAMVSTGTVQRRARANGDVVLDAVRRALVKCILRCVVLMSWLMRGSNRPNPTLNEQDGTTEDDSMNSCSMMADGNVVLTGGTLGNWDGITTEGELSAVAVKLDATDGSVIWQYQVCGTRRQHQPCFAWRSVHSAW